MPTGDGPSAVAVNPVLGRLYVTNELSDTVSVIDTGTHSTVATLAVGDRPTSVAVNTVTGRFYVTNKVSHSVSIFAADNSLMTTLTGFSGAHDVAVNETTGRAYVSNEFADTVTAIDGTTNAVLWHKAVGNQPRGVAVNEVTNRVYVANYWGDGTVTVFDGASSSTIATIDTGPGINDEPFDVAVDEQTGRIYVIRVGEPQVFDGTSYSLIGQVDLILPFEQSFPSNSLAVDSSATRLYVAGTLDQGFPNVGPSIAIIDTTDNTVEGYVNLTAETGPWFISIALDPAADNAYAGHSTLDAVVLVEEDGDGDGVGDTIDNCPVNSNSSQTDTDSDGAGDACDTDDDNDGLVDGSDNCPVVINPSQENVVHPGTTPGDACEDPDADTVVDAFDNCPDASNTAQTNTDGDSMGDACDPDDDGDGVNDGSDNCPLIVNGSQTNSDTDLLGDMCDNCPTTDNQGQANFDGDSMGDACDPDIDGDGQSNGADPDADADGIANVAETPCGADPLNHWVEPEQLWKTGVDEDGDTLLNEPLPAGAEAYDCDGDGYTGNTENYLYEYWIPGLGETFDQRSCGYLGWPTDTHGASTSDGKVTILDLTKYIAPQRYLNTNVSPGSGQNFDLIPGAGVFPYEINISDVTALISGPSGFPPMFNFAKAFNGPTCMSVQ
jgi:YVTN family beta-propeller protein